MPYLLVIRSVDKVPTGLIICVQELEGSLLVHGTHAKLVPSVSNAASPKLQWRYSYASKRAEYSIATERCRWLRGCLPQLRHRFSGLSSVTTVEVGV